MKKVLSIIICGLILILTSTLAACKGSDGIPSDPTEAGVTETEEPFEELHVEDEVEIEIEDTEDIGGL